MRMKILSVLALATGLMSVQAIAGAGAKYINSPPKATLVYDSSKIPGEIQDLLVVRHDAPEAVKKALTGAWYEAMGIMTGQGKKTDDAIEAMAKFSGGTVAEFRAQLKTTKMFYTPTEGLAFAQSQDLPKILGTVQQFCFDHGLFAQAAKSASYVGVQLPDGKVVGDPKNVKIRYLGDYMKAAADGKL